MNTPNFTDPQFIDANGVGGLNAAFANVTNAIADLSVASFGPGVLNTSAVGMTVSGNSMVLTFGASWGVVTSGGIIARAHGTLTNQDTQTYTVSFTSLIPATGSVTAYAVVSPTTIFQSPVSLPGPPQGHPSYNPNYVPTIGYTQLVYSVTAAATLSPPDNVNTFEVFRTTLTAGQSSISNSSTFYRYFAPPTNQMPIALATGGVLSVAMTQNMVVPSSSGLTSTLSPSFYRGGQFYNTYNANSGAVWTIATESGDQLSGLYGSGLASSQIIPPRGFASWWANAASGVWECVAVNPTMLTSMTLSWTNTQTFNAGGILAGYDAGGANSRYTVGGSAYGVLFREDNANFYCLVTASGSPLGTWSTFVWQFDLATGNFGHSHNLSVSGNLNVVGTTSLTGIAVTSSSLSVGTTLAVVGATTLSSTLTVAGVTTHNGVANFNTTANFGSAVNMSSTLFVAGAASLTGGASISGLTVNGSETVTGNLQVNGSANVNSSVTANFARLTFGATGSGDNNRVTTLGDFGSSSGYQKLPNGLIFQWGENSSTNATFNFPITFPNGVFVMVFGNTNQQGSFVDNAYGFAVSTSQYFCATKESQTVNAISNFPVSWVAIGF